MKSGITIFFGSIHILDYHMIFGAIRTHFILTYILGTGWKDKKSENKN
jgi:hypothetical protein